MRQVGRYIRSALTVLSFVLCVATVALWWRATRTADHVTYTWPIENGQRVRLCTLGVIGNRGSPVLTLERGTLIPANSAAAAWVLRSEAASCAKFEHWEDPPGPPDVPVAGRDRWGFFVGSSDAVERYRITPNGPIYVAPFRYCTLATPWWFLAVLFSIGPSRALWRWHRARRRVPVGHCLACGYDLRATPDRCPECGTIPTKVKA